MSTTIIINDYVNNRRAHLVFVMHDFEVMARFWSSTDRVLEELQPHPAFAGRTRWCDLEPKHYRLLLMQNLVAADALDEQRLTDDDHPVVRSLNFLFMALCHCLALRVGGEIEVLRVNRLTKTDITYEVAAALMRLDVEVGTVNAPEDAPEATPDAPDAPAPDAPRFGPGFRVIVDNTGPERT